MSNPFDEESSDKPLSDDAYWRAISRAVEELNELKQKEKDILVRKAQLGSTLNALWPLVTSKTIDISSLTLADAVRFIVNSAGRPVSAIDIRSKLADWNYDLGEHENALASIHTAMKRMIEAGELVPTESEGGKKKFEPGPEIKAILPGSGNEVKD